MLEYNLEFIKKYKISIIIGMLMLFFCMSFYLFILNHKVKCNNVEEFVIISRGSSASSIGTLLQDNECFEDINIFKLALKITMNSKKIRPGRYDFKGVSSMRQLIDTITSHPGDIIKVHPTQLYESIIYFIVFLLLSKIRKNNLFNGYIIYLYLLFAGLSRFIIEFYRINPKYLIGLSGAQCISVIMIIVAFLCLYKNKNLIFNQK